MTDWQPIETAPKDGTVVRLLCRLTNQKTFEAKGYYNGLSWSTFPDGRLLDAIHWMPLTDAGYAARGPQ